MVYSIVRPELKSCPFCGNAVNWCDCGGDCPQITCKKCGQFDFVEHSDEDLEAAFNTASKKWNTRANGEFHDSKD